MTTRIFVSVDADTIFKRPVQLMMGVEKVQTITAHVEPGDHVEAAKLINSAIKNGFRPVLHIEAGNAYHSTIFKTKHDITIMQNNASPAMVEVGMSIRSWMDKFQ